MKARLKLFINEPDVYASVDFRAYDCIGAVHWRGETVPGKWDFDGVLVALRDVVDDAFLSPFERIRYVVSNTTGIDHIRTSRAVEIIKLDSHEIENVSATAEFSLALLLSLVRKIPFIDPGRPGDRLAYRGTQLRGKRVGIFGMGRLGRRMAKYAEALDMSWLGYDREDGESEKEEILRTSDILTLHLPLTRETIGFIGRREFSVMEKKPFLLNTSRPQLVEKEALLEALDCSRIAGAAMDFIDYEARNEWDPALLKYAGAKLLLTPHVAGNTHESVAYTARVVVEKLVRKYKQGGRAGTVG